MTACTTAMLKQPVAIARERFELPEFGDDTFAFVYGLTAKENSDYESSNMNRKWTGVNPVKLKTTKERLVILSLRDEGGTRLLQDGDIGIVQAWPSGLLARVFDVASRLNGHDVDNEELVKNSEETIVG